ncbi:MAG: peptide MFS transporter [Candidatus Aminicenantes bacterium]|nr:peptide MFS transporter [Candidatus Aminicenantes bacterium]
MEPFASSALKPDLQGGLMLKGHPKGLIVAFFANMGERFGFYTMMAILVLFLQAKYNLSAEAASGYYSWFYYAIYALALLGGIVADSTNKYKLVILFGIVIMFFGYGVLAVPGMPLTITLIGLFVIALGNGLFKGNLQAVVGQLYDDPKYSKVRDTAFMIFYMGINVGAFFAPFVATGIRDWFLRTQGFLHDASLPKMCHAYLNNTLTGEGAINHLETLASKVSGTLITGADQLREFAADYINAFAKGYNYAFGIAAGAMIISLVVYVVFSRHLPSRVKSDPSKGDPSQVVARIANLPSITVAIGAIVITSLVFHLLLNDLALGMAIGLFLGFVAFIFKTSTKQEKPRVIALVLVFVVVIFFWMSFHQNGLTLTFFARDFTQLTVGPVNNIFFNVESMIVFIGSLAGLFLLLFKKGTLQKLIGLVMFTGFGAATYYFYSGYKAQNPIAPEIFQSFNPMFIVVLTFPVMAIFGWLRKRNMEPSTPTKIGIGMVIAAIAFVVMLVGSLKLAAPKLIATQNLTEWDRISPHWLISTYLILTIAELFLSPMGLSFVSKVSPVRFQGLMQGGWLLATATGNKLLFVGGYFWDKLELWQLWSIFVVCSILSASFILSIRKKLDKASIA